MAIKVSLVMTSDDAAESASEEGLRDGAGTHDRAPPESLLATRARPLSDQVRRFVREYVRDRDGTAAAARAGYSRNNATHWAEATLGRPEVQAAISAELARREAAQRDIKERVLDEVMRIAFSDPGRIARWTPEGITLIHSVDLTDDDRAAVKRITLGPSPGKGKKRAQLFEMHDKLAALELLSRLTGMLPRGKAPMPIDQYDGRDPREVLRERLMKIVRAGEKKEGDATV
jgi:phage terminase small subunit